MKQRMIKILSLTLSLIWAGVHYCHPAHALVPYPESIKDETKAGCPGQLEKILEKIEQQAKENADFFNELKNEIQSIRSSGRFGEARA